MYSDRKVLVAIVFAITLQHGLLAQTNTPEVLVVSGRPTDDLGIPGDNLAFMYNFSLSANGLWWVGEFELDNGLDSVMLRGIGSGVPQVVWAEHDAVPGFPDEEFRAILDDRPNDIDDAGRVVGIARRNLAGLNRPLLFNYDGQQLTIVATQDQTIPGLPIQYGNTLHSPNVMNNASAAFVAEDLNGTVSDENQIGLFSDGNQVGPRTGITVYAGELLADFNDERFFVNRNNFFLFDGNTNGPAASNEIVVFGEVGTNGTVLLKEDTSQIMLPNGDVELFDRADQIYLAENNDWYVLGDTNGSGVSTEVAIRNGHVIGAEGEDSPDGFAYDQPIALAGDPSGNFAWIWETTNPDLDRDTVLVYNGDQLLLSEGDTIFVDYDNDGEDEPAVIEFLHLDARNLAVAGGYVYLMVEIDQPDTTFIGNAFIRIPVFVLGDVNRDGAVDLLDVQPFVDLISNGQFQIEADTNQDGQVDLLDVTSFVQLLTEL